MKDSTREEFDELVTKSIFYPNRFGARFIPAVTDLAKQMHVEDIIENDKKGEYLKKTPSMKIRIIAALMDIATEMNAPVVNHKIASEKFAILSELAKQVRMSMLSNKLIDTSNWTKIESNYKLYYCLILEDLANDRDIPIFRCKDQWAASLLLSQAIKNKSDSDKKKRERNIVEEEVL